MTTEQKSAPMSAVAVAWLSPEARRLVLLMLAVFSGLLLVDSTSGSVLLGLFTISGILVASGGPRLSREEKLMVFAFVTFFLVAMASWLAGGVDEAGWRTLGRHGRLLLFVPVFLLFRRIPDGETAWWISVSLGAALAGIFSLLVSVGGDIPLVAGLTGEFLREPVTTAFIALLLGFLALAGSGRLREVHLAASSFSYAAFLLASIAVLLSGSRGVWIAIPGLLMLLLFLVNRHQRDWQRLWLATSLVLLFAVAYMIQASGLERNLQDVGESFTAWLFGSQSSGTLGVRSDMAVAAWNMFVEHPWSGVGVGNYPQELASMIRQGTAPDSIARFSHPHSEYLLTMATRGIPGLIALGLLFGIPLAQFSWAANHPDAAVRRLACGGLVVVVGFMQLALAESVFNRSMAITFYTVTLAVSWGLLRAREMAWLNESKTRRETVSVTVITLNEADRIRRCLDAVHGWADEIVVLDSGSTDNTVEIVRQYTDKVEVTDWPGYGAQKQRAADRCSSDWIFSIDADEIVPADLKSEIDGELHGNGRYDSFRFPWSVEIFGERVDFGADGRKHLRLFRREGPARFNDARVHEGVVRGGRMRSLHGAVIHETFRDFRHLLEKFGDYATLQASARHERGRRASVAGATLRSVFSFLSLYFYRLGMLDGRRGLLMAVLYAHYTFNKYAALWALEQRDRTGRK